MRCKYDGQRQAAHGHLACNGLQASCKNLLENTKLAMYLLGIYGKEITVHRGNNYLDLDLDYLEKGLVVVSMIKYLQKVIKEFLEKITGSAATPAAEYLFMVHEPEFFMSLPEEQTQQYHHVVAQLMLMATREEKKAYSDGSCISDNESTENIC